MGPRLMGSLIGAREGETGSVSYSGIIRQGLNKTSFVELIGPRGFNK